MDSFKPAYSAQLAMKIDPLVALRHELEMEQGRRRVGEDVSGSRPRKTTPGNLAIEPETE
jgi:hypothetical protein